MKFPSHIRRIDQPVSRTHCWKVQVRRKNHLLTMPFSDATYGGKKKALDAAKAWRDAALTRLDQLRGCQYDHLCRVESGAHGRYWQGLIQCREVRLTMRFNDGDHGGKRGALTAALAWRDANLAASTQDRWLRSVTQVRSNNRSGIVGVGRYVAVEVVKGRRRESPFWMARWNSAEGKSKCRKFSVGKYGEEGARNKAVRARNAAISQAKSKRLSDMKA